MMRSSITLCAFALLFASATPLDAQGLAPDTSKRSDTSAVRATFIIDPDRMLRAMLYYPMSNGRSIPEIVRLVTAMQASDANGVATPAGWEPGDDAIVPPPKTTAAATKREGEGFAYTDWYFSKRPLEAA